MKSRSWAVSVAGVATLLSLVGMARAQAKIAVIDTQRIIVESEVGKRAMADLEAHSREREGRIKALQEELRMLREQLSEGANTLSEAAVASLREKIQDRTTTIKRQADDAQSELNRLRENALKEIEGRVFPIINQIGAEAGYSMIFRKFESGLIFCSDDIDITATVIERLDQTEPNR